MNGTLINYFVHCKRQCYLLYNRLNLEDNSELVAIGKAIHETRLIGENTELRVENISIDKITRDYVVEVKKTDADQEAARWQLIYYLYKLKEKGIEKKGKLEFVESRGKKTEIIELTDEIEKELKEKIRQIEALCMGNEVPKAIKIRGCNKCAYYEYCFI